MSPLVDFLFGQYSTYAPLDIAIEITAVLLGLASVWYAKQNKVAVYPTGMISTALFVYLLLKWGLIGDMLINAYYFIISIYGWYFWIQKREGETLHPISRIKRREVALSVFLFLLSLGFVYTIYQLFALWNGWTAYVDTFTTAIFFVGMWLMARRKIEHWLFWIVGDIISVPLYFHKGLTLTSLQYIIFTLMAFYGYRSWKKALN